MHEDLLFHCLHRHRDLGNTLTYFRAEFGLQQERMWTAFKGSKTGNAGKNNETRAKSSEEISISKELPLPPP